MADDLHNKSKEQLIKEIRRLERQLASKNKLSRAYENLKEDFEDARVRLWRLTDMLPNSVFETDLQGNIKFANATGLRVFGRTVDDLKKGFTAFDVVAPEEHEKLKIAMRHVLSGEHRPAMPYMGISKDGARIPVAIQASRVIKDGKIVGIRGVILDITKIQQATDIIQQAKDDLENAVAQRSHELELTSDKLNRILEETIMALSSAIEKRDPYTAGHQSRVAKLAGAIAAKIELGADQLKGLYMAALVHDIGKIYIPAEILSKPAKLNRIEHEIIKMHPAVGYEILSAIEFPWPIADIVSQHHERIDGSGYPGGLTGDKLLVEAKILSVADVVEAMASHRPYRPSLGVEKALAEIEDNKGILYDAGISRACLKLFRKEGFEF